MKKNPARRIIQTRTTRLTSAQTVARKHRATNNQTATPEAVTVAGVVTTDHETGAAGIVTAAIGVIVIEETEVGTTATMETVTATVTIGLILIVIATNNHATIVVGTNNSGMTEETETIEATEAIAAVETAVEETTVTMTRAVEETRIGGLVPIIGVTITGTTVGMTTGVTTTGTTVGMTTGVTTTEPTKIGAMTTEAMNALIQAKAAVIGIVTGTETGIEIVKVGKNGMHVFLPTSRHTWPNTIRERQNSKA
jgi:hypothetical protein